MFTLYIETPVTYDPDYSGDHDPVYSKIKLDVYSLLLGSQDNLYSWRLRENAIVEYRGNGEKHRFPYNDLDDLLSSASEHTKSILGDKASYCDLRDLSLFYACFTLSRNMGDHVNAIIWLEKFQADVLTALWGVHYSEIRKITNRLDEVISERDQIILNFDQLQLVNGELMPIGGTDERED